MQHGLLRLVERGRRAELQLPLTAAMVGRFGRAADALLGSVWISLAAAKVLHAERDAYLVGLLGHAIGTTVTWFVVLLESVLGSLLIAGSLVWRSRVRGASVGLLLAFGVLAVAEPASPCRCAGQLVLLSPQGRLLLVAVMFALAGTGALAPSAPSGRGKACHRAPAARARIAALLLASMLISTWLLVQVGQRGQTTAISTDAELRAVVSISLASAPELHGTDRGPGPAVSTGQVTQANHDGGQFRGRVVLAEGGDPVEGARVWAATAEAPAAFACPAVTSGRNGDFVLSQSGPQPPSRLFVLAPGSRAWSADIADLPRQDGVLVAALAIGRVIQGRVLDPDGRPLPAARVEARAAHAEDVADPEAMVGWERSQAPELAVGRADEQGAFALRGLGAGPYAVHAFLAGFGVPIDGQRGATVVPEPLPGSSVNLTLWPLYEARIRVVDDATGEPLRFATIAADVVEDEHWGRASDGDGRRRASGRAPGSALLGEGTARTTLYRRSQEAPRHDVQFSIVAHGYPKTQVWVAAARVGTAEPMEVRVRRAATELLAKVTLRLVLPGERRGPTGRFRCALGRDQDLLSAPGYSLWFEEGKAVEPLPLPAGRYTFSMRGLYGGVGLVEAYARGSPLTFQVGNPEELMVDIPVSLGRVCVQARTEAGEPVSHYVLGVQTPAGERRVLTWLDLERPDPCEGPDGNLGRLFWLPAGACRLSIGKDGYDADVIELDVPGDGTLLRWQPVLRRKH